MWNGTRTPDFALCPAARAARPAFGGHGVSVKVPADGLDEGWSAERAADQLARARRQESRIIGIAPQKIGETRRPIEQAPDAGKAVVTARQRGAGSLRPTKSL